MEERNKPSFQTPCLICGKVENIVGNGGKAGYQHYVYLYFLSCKVFYEYMIPFLDH